MKRLSRFLVAGLVALAAATLSYAAVGTRRMDCCGKSCPSSRAAPLRTCCQAAPTPTGNVVRAPSTPFFILAAGPDLATPAPPRPGESPAWPAPKRPPGFLSSIPTGLSPPTARLG